MLTPKQEQYCRNRAIKKLSQRQAYIDAYPKAEEWKPATVDARACELEADSKILVRLKELRDEQTAIMTQEAVWTRQKAFKELDNLITLAKEEIAAEGKLTMPNVKAIIDAVKELNTIYAVGEKAEGGGVLEDILDAVRRVDK